MSTIEINNYLKENKMKTLNTEIPIYYQSSSKFNNNPMQVVIIKKTKKTAIVETTSVAIPTKFKCRISSLYNIE